MLLLRHPCNSFMLFNYIFYYFKFNFSCYISVCGYMVLCHIYIYVYMYACVCVCIYMLCTYSVKIVLVAFLSFFFSLFSPYFITAGGLPGISIHTAGIFRKVRGDFTFSLYIAFSETAAQWATECHTAPMPLAMRLLPAGDRQAGARSCPVTST
jgi:hypothetical protein